MEDIKEKIQEIIEKIQKDKNFAEKFAKDPIKTVEKLLGVDLPEQQLEKVVAAVKAKVNIDSVGKLLDSDGDGKPDLGAISKLGSLLGKK